ncbi:hypothetical protein ABPG73_018137, partial [Tetrahymena malaccensis]
NLTGEKNAICLSLIAILAPKKSLIQKKCLNQDTICYFYGILSYDQIKSINITDDKQDILLKQDVHSIQVLKNMSILKNILDQPINNNNNILSQFY